MTVVSMSKLKAHLSRYLREVSRGGEIQIVDRGRPVARLVAMVEAADTSEEDQRKRLVASGVLRPGNGRIGDVLREPPPVLPVSLAAALEEERADRL